MTNSDLYGHPELYDALLPVRAELPYYADLAQRAGGDVLELGCGTGQFTVPLAQAGFGVTGIDLSETMVRAANQRAEAAGVQAEHASGDMRSFELGRQFGLIFIARNSLLHLHSSEDLLAAFGCVRRHLAPGGVFAFDIFNPKVTLLARPAQQRFPVMQVESESFGLLTVESAGEYDAAQQVNYSRWYVSAPGKPDAWVLPLNLRSIFPQELPLLLSAAGFRLKHRFGEMDGRPFDSASRIQACVCEVVS